MAENSEDKTPSNLETQSWLHRSYHRFRHVIWKYVMKFSKIFLVGVFETQSWIRRGYDRFRHTARKFSRNLSLIIRRFFSSSILMAIIVGILVLLLVGFVSVMFSKTVEEYIGTLLGLPGQKNQILTFLGIGMGGVLVALQALMSYRRAKAMEGTVQNTENGLRQERLKNAIEHLGHASETVRMGGAHELFHLADDNLKLRQTVLDILCAHIRYTTGEDKYRKTHQSKPSQEVQSLLTLLFVQEHDVFKGLHINLQNSWLNGVDLQKARLQKAIFKQANLRGARLDMAQLQEANLVEVHLEEAVLEQAGMQGADIRMTKLQGATLSQVRLEGVDLSGAHLQAAYLNEAHLQGANLASVRLQGAILSGARLQSANLLYTHMQGAILRKANLKGAGNQEWSSSTPFAERIIKSIGKESELSTVSSGGICQRVADALEEGLSDEKARILREMLGADIDKPFGRGLPENSGAITGAYTEEEAEKWIDEYEEAISEVPTDKE